jgi:hypothetical protein
MRTYLEIGTNAFDTLNDKFADRFNWRGVSIEAVPEYFNKLQKRDKNTYINAICTVENSGPQAFYYVPPDIINQYNLPAWLRGCGSLYMQKQPSLQTYSQYVVTQKFPTVSIDTILKFETLSGRIDLLKIDTEGFDFQLLNAILDKTIPTNVIFETVFMKPENLSLLDTRLRKLGYTFKGRLGDSVQYSVPSTLLIVDANWSTGSIAKDLQYISKSRHISYLDWAKYIEPIELEQIISEYDSVAAFCLSSPHGWPLLAKHGVVCCGKIEVDWIKDKKLLGDCFGAVSYETYCELAKLAVKPIYYTPVSARISRFTPRKEASPIKTLGWCGVPVSAQNFGGIDAKRFSMFEEIVAKTGLESRVSNQEYTYANMQEFYDSIDLLVCTSSTEGGPLGVFEAIACGVPVISTDVGLVKEMDSIRKFDTVQMACDFIEKLNHQELLLQKYRSNQYCQLFSEFCTEQLFGYWEDFFLACDCLNSKVLLF